MSALLARCGVGLAPAVPTPAGSSAGAARRAGRLVPRPPMPYVKSTKSPQDFNPEARTPGTRTAERPVRARSPGGLPAGSRQAPGRHPVPPGIAPGARRRRSHGRPHRFDPPARGGHRPGRRAEPPHGPGQGPTPHPRRPPPAPHRPHPGHHLRPGPGGRPAARPVPRPGLAPGPGPPPGPGAAGRAPRRPGGHGVPLRPLRGLRHAGSHPRRRPLPPDRGPRRPGGRTGRRRRPPAGRAPGTAAGRLRPPPRPPGRPAAGGRRWPPAGPLGLPGRPGAVGRGGPPPPGRPHPGLPGQRQHPGRLGGLAGGGGRRRGGQGRSPRAWNSPGDAHGTAGRPGAAAPREGSP